MLTSFVCFLNTDLFLSSLVKLHILQACYTTNSLLSHFYPLVSHFYPKLIFPDSVSYIDITSIFNVFLMRFQRLVVSNIVLYHLNT